MHLFNQILDVLALRKIHQYLPLVEFAFAKAKQVEHFNRPLPHIANY